MSIEENRQKGCSNLHVQCPFLKSSPNTIVSSTTSPCCSHGTYTAKAGHSSRFQFRNLPSQPPDTTRRSATSSCLPYTPIGDFYIVKLSLPLLQFSQQLIPSPQHSTPSTQQYRREKLCHCLNAEVYIVSNCKNLA